MRLGLKTDILTGVGGGVGVQVPGLPAATSDWRFNDAAGSLVSDGMGSLPLTANGTYAWADGLLDINGGTAGNYLSSANGTYGQLDTFTVCGWITFDSLPGSEDFLIIGDFLGVLAANYSLRIQQAFGNRLRVLVSDGVATTTADTGTLTISTGVKYFFAMHYVRYGGAANNTIRTWFTSDGITWYSGEVLNAVLLSKNATFEIYSKLTSVSVGADCKYHRVALFKDMALGLDAFKAIYAAGSEAELYKLYGGAANFNPIFISNAGIMEADAGITKDGSNLVSRWDDKSTNGVWWSQSTDANKPTWIASAWNAKPALRFDGTTDKLTGDAEAKAITKNRSGFTTIAAASVDAAASGGVRYLYNHSVGTSANGRNVCLQNNTTLTFGGRRLDADASDAASQASFWATANTLYVNTFKMDHQNTRGDFYRNGKLIGSDTAMNTAGTTSNTSSQSCGIGDNNGANFWDGDLAALFFLDHTATEKERELYESYLAWKYGVQVPWVIRYQFMLDGDSICASSGVSSPNTLGEQLVARWGTVNYAATNYGTSGHTIANADTEAATTIDTATLPPNATPTLVLICGTNDVAAGRTNAQILADLRTYVQNRVAAGKVGRIGICTMIARTGLTSAIQSANNHIVSNWSTLVSDGADFRVDLHLLPQFDEEADTANGTYYQGDAIHPTATGLGLIADSIKTAFEAWGGG